VGVAAHHSARRLADAHASLLRFPPAVRRTSVTTLNNPHMGCRKLSARPPVTFTWPSIGLKRDAGWDAHPRCYATLLSTPCSIITRRLQNSEISVSE
jgi:hypothetical protein